jgi:hypothetical protein
MKGQTCNEEAQTKLEAKYLELEKEKKKISKKKAATIFDCMREREGEEDGWVGRGRGRWVGRERDGRGREGEGEGDWREEEDVDSRFTKIASDNLPNLRKYNLF